MAQCPTGVLLQLGNESQVTERTNNKQLYRRLFSLRSHGITKEEDLMEENHGAWYYEMRELGYNYRLTDMQAALALSHLSRAGAGLIDHAFPLDRAYIGYKFSDHHIAGSHSTHNFIVGMGFFLTQDLTRYACRAQGMLLDGFPEDGIVGSWFVGTKAEVIHDPRFHDIDHVNTVTYAPCSNTSLLLHHMWSRRNWEAVDGEGLLKC